VVLAVDHLTTVRGLTDFSLQLHKGEILGIGGLSHCGMHELGRAIFGVESVLAGTVTHVPSGETIASPRAAIKHMLAYVPKDRDREALVLAASIKDNLVSASYDRISTGRFFISPRKEKRYVDEQISEFSVKCSSRDQYVQFLSGGNRQKVVFGKWVGRGSDILVLDCPTRGIDIGVKAAMYQLMYRMKQEGKSIVLISEELPELIGMSDRLLILKDGRRTAEFRRSSDLTEAMIIEHMI
jgi:ribose transport system ATP-binding protein